MRKKMLFLALALSLTAALTAPRTAAAGYYACPICTTYADGSQCCVSCICNGLGQTVACTDHYCPPEEGEVN
jgi:hypothetical protein